MKRKEWKDHYDLMTQSLDICTVKFFFVLFASHSIVIGGANFGGT